MDQQTAHYMTVAMQEAMYNRRPFSMHFTGGSFKRGWWAMNQGMARRIK